MSNQPWGQTSAAAPALEQTARIESGIDLAHRLDSRCQQCRIFSRLLSCVCDLFECTYPDGDVSFKGTACPGRRYVLCVFEETSILKFLLPSVGGCPLRIHEKRALGAVDSVAANAAGKWSAIGFVDEAAVLSWYNMQYS